VQSMLCPICDTDQADHELYPANFREEDLTPEVFSARRRPDRLHYRMVRCGRCGLVRSNPILPAGTMARLYASSHFTYGSEATFARRTYGHYLRRARRWARSEADLLEIGCGNGFFLEEALDQGFQRVAGIEPSTEAVAQASDTVRPHISSGLYQADSFPAGSFDMICAFQVFDHVPDPRSMLLAIRDDLRDDGVALFINHDAGGLLNRALGEASPIVDIEHTVLFDKTSMRRLLERCGLVVREVFSVRNTYPLQYWLRLAPMPRTLKAGLDWLLAATGLGRIPVTLGAGNLGVVASKG
jgi:SAM-dependent methyltransferase